MQQTLRAYYRLTKPGIVYGNTLSVIAGFLLASNGDIDPLQLVTTVIAIALIMASACVYNNFIDRGIDAHMARTKKRALVTGSVGKRPALTYATVLCTLGFTALVLFTNTVTVALGVIAIIMYVAVYGFAKRRSPWGTIIGSVSGALPPAAGYTAVTGQFDGAAWLLFITMTLWQMPHFYAIAIYRLKDYKAAGIPVLPAVRGIPRARRSIIGYVIAYTLVAPLLAIFGPAGYLYFIVVGTMGLLWLARGIMSYRHSKPETWARGMFFFSLGVLLAWTLAIAIDSFFN